jgi:phosphoribosylformylglycinamidine synthase
LAVAAVESCFSRPEAPLGAVLNLTSAIRKDILLFGESQSRILISFPKKSQGAIEAMARKTNSDFAVIGEVGGSSFSATVNDEEFILEDIQELNQLWRGSLGNYARQVT